MPHFGDIDLGFTPSGRKLGIVFDGLLSLPPAETPTVRRLGKITRRKPDDQFPPLHTWKIQPLTYRSLRRIISHGETIEVYTMLVEHADEINAHLCSWGVEPHRVIGFGDAWQMGQYVRGDNDIHTVWVPNRYFADEIGARAMLIEPGKELRY